MCMYCTYVLYVCTHCPQANHHCQQLATGARRWCGKGLARYWGTYILYMRTYVRTYVCAACTCICIFTTVTLWNDCMSQWCFPFIAIVGHNNQDPHLLSPSGQAQLLLLLPSSWGGQQCLLPNPWLWCTPWPQAETLALGGKFVNIHTLCVRTYVCM